MKKFLFMENGSKVAKDMEFEELYEYFFNSIQKESWSLVKRYSFLTKEEVDQQFTIELWTAYEKYDLSKGQCVSTYIYWRFNRARSALLHPNIGSKKAKFKNEKVNSLDSKVAGEDSADFSNQKFESDSNYEKMCQSQPDNSAIENELFNLIDGFLPTTEEKDLVRVLMDKKEYSVADYAKNWNISRVAANKRLNKLKGKLGLFLQEQWA